MMRSLVLLLIAVLACTPAREQDSEMQTIGLALNINTVPADSALIDRAEQGLIAWQIGLGTTYRARYRNTGGAAGSYDPANWLALSPRNCSVMGSTAALRQNCPLSDTVVVGVCQIVSDTSTGAILNTTSLIATDFQLNEAVALSDRISIFSHEIGHCLGLQHSASNSDLMYPNTSGVDAPSAGELSVIQFAYTTYTTPVDSSRFFHSGSNALRHFQKPAFFLYDETNYASSQLQAMPTPPANPVEVHTFLLFADGRTHHYREM